MYLRISVYNDITRVEVISLLEEFVSSKILFLCQQQDISRYELSARSGVSQAVISDLVRKRHVVSLVTLDKLCKGFGITLSQFFLTVDEIPGLSEEQKEILQLWESLKVDEQRALKLTMKNLKNRE